MRDAHPGNGRIQKLHSDSSRKCADGLFECDPLKAPAFVLKHREPRRQFISIADLRLRFKGAPTLQDFLKRGLAIFRSGHNLLRWSDIRLLQQRHHASQ